jgi:hypothetical protein
MGGAAQVSSIDVIRQFAAAVVTFQEEARLCLSALDAQLRQILFWLERDRPMFWKREVENCMREIADARVRLHQCRMRRLGDFRPSCIEEVKALEKAQKDIEFAQLQVPTVKRWHAEAAHEANEYHGRASQIVQSVERDIPRLLALLSFTIDRLEAYAAVTTPNAAPDRSFFENLNAELQSLMNRTSPPESPAMVESDSPRPDEDPKRDD